MLKDCVGDPGERGVQPNSGLLRPAQLLDCKLVGVGGSFLR